MNFIVVCLREGDGEVRDKCRKEDFSTANYVFFFTENLDCSHREIN